MNQGIRVRTIEAANALLTEGFHGFEADHYIRWTDGDLSVRQESSTETFHTGAEC